MFNSSLAHRDKNWTKPTPQALLLGAVSQASLMSSLSKVSGFMAIAKLLPKAIRNACLSGKSCQPRNLCSYFYRRTGCILPCQVLQALPQRVCVGITPRGELTRTGIVKEVCTQHWSRKLPCAANMIFSHLSRSGKLSLSKSVFSSLTVSKARRNTDPFSPMAMGGWKPMVKKLHGLHPLFLTSANGQKLTLFVPRRSSSAGVQSPSGRCCEQAQC